MAVIDKAFERADGHRRINLPPAAGGLAGRTTYPAARGGEGIDLAGNQVSLLIIAPGNGSDIAAGVGTDGTGKLAGHQTTVIVKIRHKSLKTFSWHIILRLL